MRPHEGVIENTESSTADEFIVTKEDPIYGKFDGNHGVQFSSGNHVSHSNNSGSHVSDPGGYFSGEALANSGGGSRRSQGGVSFKRIGTRRRCRQQQQHLRARALRCSNGTSQRGSDGDNYRDVRSSY